MMPMPQHDRMTSWHHLARALQHCHRQIATTGKKDGVQIRRALRSTPLPPGQPGRSCLGAAGWGQAGRQQRQLLRLPPPPPAAAVHTSLAATCAAARWACVSAAAGAAAASEGMPQQSAGDAVAAAARQGVAIHWHVATHLLHPMELLAAGKCAPRQDVPRAGAPARQAAAHPTVRHTREALPEQQLPRHHTWVAHRML